MDEAKENLHNLARKVISKQLEKLQMVVKRLEKAFDLRRKERKENEQYRLALLKQSNDIVCINMKNGLFLELRNRADSTVTHPEESSP